MKEVIKIGAYRKIDINKYEISLLENIETMSEYALVKTEVLRKLSI